MRLVLFRLQQVLVSVTAILLTMTSSDRLEAEEDGDDRGEYLLENDPYMPNFLPTPANVTFLTGAEAVLKCAIENRGTRTVVWRRASEPNPLTIGLETFVGDRRFSVSHAKHSLEWNLHIRHATPNDSGVYECHVITKSRDIRQMILLHVDEAKYVPKFKPAIQIRGSQYVEKGDTLTLTCNASGMDYPPDELDWFKDGVKLVNNGRLQLIKDVSLSDKTIVSKLQVSRSIMTDAGTYVCRASELQITSVKVNVLDGRSDTEKRAESTNHSTTGFQGVPHADAICPSLINSRLSPLLASLFVYLITS